MGNAMNTVRLDAVRLLNGPMLRAQQADLATVLELDPDRLLAPILREAGLPLRAEPYGNWESSGLDGHIAGHYLSALAALHASTGDDEVARRLVSMIDEIARAQEAGGDGYVGGVPDGRALWADVAARRIDVSSFGLGGRWVPWYNLHKLFAGLIDAWRIAGSRTALDVVVRLGEWWLPIGEGLDDQAFESMLSAEFGGMNEVFADLAELTGREAFADMARRFSHRAILDPLLEGRDALTGLHANTQIPKVIGYARLGVVTGDEALLGAARTFWHTVAEHRSVAIGGNSTREHFHPADDFSSQVEEREGPETCNTVNMVKLSKVLHGVDGDPAYLDYAERALVNHLLSAQHPERGGFVYFTPMRPAHYRVYSTTGEGFWCCVGSGLEAQARYGELVFGREGDAVAVQLFVPAQLDAHDLGVRLTVQAALPDDDLVRIAVQATAPSRFPLRVRIPGWLAGAPEWSLNDEPTVPTSVGSGFATFKRVWQDGDALSVRLPMTVRAERLPDGSDWVAFTAGPAVLAARGAADELPGLFADDSRMGHIAHGPLVPLAATPVVVHDGDPAARVTRTGPGARFLMRPDDDAQPIALEPFAGIHGARYTVYWPDTTRDRAEARRAALADEDRATIGLDDRTLDVLTAGEQQPESDHGFRGEDSSVGMVDGIRFRSATGWFGYRFSDPGGDGTVLRVTFHAAAEERRCIVELAGTRIGETVVAPSDSHERVEVDYVLPEPAGGSVAALDVVFRAADGLRTPDVLTVRLLR
jgi:DUF1680 family protein